MSQGKQFKSTVLVDVRHRAFLIGHKGKRINKLREECGNVVIIIPKSDKPSEAVEVSGAEVQVKKAIGKIKEVCKTLVDSETTVKVTLPDTLPASLLASGSTARLKLSHDYCCKVELVAGGREVSLLGSPENCVKAKSFIEHLILENGMATPVGPNAQKGKSSTDHAVVGKEDGLTVSKQLCVALNGYNRKLLRSICLECDKVNISISETNQVSMSGSDDGLAYAKDQLEKLNADVDCVASVQHIAVKAHYHKFMLSSYAIHSRLQRQKLGIRIVLPDSIDGSRELIYIFGRKKDTQDIKKKMESLVIDLKKHCRSNIPVPAEHTNRFTEQRGKVLKQVSADIGCGVHLHLEGVGAKSEHLSVRQIVFSGPPVCFPAAEEKIKDLISQYDSYRTQTCRIPFDLFDAVRGPKGAYIQQLMEDYEVTISFPPPQPIRRKHLLEHVGEVTVSGHVDNVERACDELMAAVPVCREVRVPLEYYSFFAGHKSSYLDQLKEEFQVVIKVKPAEDLHGIIVVIGPEDDVISCCQYIEQQVGLLAQEHNHREKLRFSMEVEVDLRYQKKLIGKKGVKLRQLCSQYHIDITMPPKGNETSTTVLLQGYEERCKQAASEIRRFLHEIEDKTTALVDTVPGDFHRKLVGHHGRNIRTISEKFSVEIKVPQSNTDGAAISITGGSENVQKCADHIRSLAEQHVKSLEEENDKKELMKLYVYGAKKRAPSISEVFQMDNGGPVEKRSRAATGLQSSSPSSTSASSGNNGTTAGFVVTDAPWSPKSSANGGGETTTTAAAGQQSSSSKTTQPSSWPHRTMATVVRSCA